MKKIAIISLSVISIFLFGCDQSSDIIGNNSQTSGSAETCSLTGADGNSCTENATALDTAKEIILALKNKDIQTLVTYINPATKVRFSPYSYVNTETDMMLNAQETIQAYQNTGEVRNRGVYDGSGEPINLATQDYFQKFVYDLDFLNAPEIIENQEIMRGNIINNAFDVYQNTDIIEFYIPGIDPKYDGMDRRSLTLVLQKTDEKRYLIGIVHNQRTI